MAKSEFLISLITPIYNRSKIFDRTLQSVLSNLDKQIEYLVISDGSEDIEELKHLVNSQGELPNLKLLHYSDNGGVGKALNFGISQASGEWVTFLGSDDLLLPNWFEEINNCINEKRDYIDFLYFKLLYENGIETPSYRKNLSNLTFENYISYIDDILIARKSNPSQSLDMGIVAKKEIAQMYPFSEGWTYENKWHLDLNFSGNGYFLNSALKFINTDSADRLSVSNFKISSRLDAVKNLNQAVEFEKVLKVYGYPLSMYGPVYRQDIKRKSLRRRFNLCTSPSYSVKAIGLLNYLLNLVLLVKGSVEYLSRELHLKFILKSRHKKRD